MSGIPETTEKWILVEVDGSPVSSASNIHFQIDGESLTGFDGCNRFAGSLNAVSAIRGTQRGCPPEVFQIRPAVLLDAIGGERPTDDIVTLELGASGEQTTFRKVGIDDS